MATFTLYGSDVTNGTLATACTMAPTTGGTETSIGTNCTVTGTTWLEIRSHGSAAATGFTAIQAPSGKGWGFAPGAGTFALGNWSASITLSCTGIGTVDLTVRFYKLSGGSYTSIGTINKTGIVTAKTTYAFAATSMPATTFGAADLLYIDLWFHDTGNVINDFPIIYLTTSATVGVAGDMQITTSSFAIQRIKDIASRFRLMSANKAKDIVSRFRLMSAAARKDLASRFRLQSANQLHDLASRLRDSAWHFSKIWRQDSACAAPINCMIWR
jgi:hypothetical protein